MGLNMAYKFRVIEDISETLAWCSENLGPDLKTNTRWCWDFGFTQRTAVITIVDDEDSMAYRLRWH